MGKYKINENFFQEVNSEQVAYVLGLLYADGWVEPHTIGIELLEHDLDILVKIKACMQAEQPIIPKVQKINNKIKNTFRIHNTKLVRQIINLGCFPRKSLTLKFPTFDIVPEQYMSHFIRGYFDGDGSVSEGKNVKVNFTGNTEFIIALRNYLSLKSGLNANKPNFGKSPEKTFCTMEWSGRGNAKKLYTYLYNNATIYGNRKRNKFIEICALKEKSLSETRLIAGKPEMVISSQALEKSIEGSSTIPEMGVESSDSKCLAPNR